MKIKEKPVQKTFKMSSLKANKIKMAKKSKFKAGKPKKKIDLNKMSVDEFMSGGFQQVNEDANSEFGDILNDITGKTLKTKKALPKLKQAAKLKRKPEAKLDSASKRSPGFSKKLEKKTAKKKKKLPLGDEEDETADEEVEDEEGDADDGEMDSEPELDDDMFSKHKKQLDGLKTTDPEFYKYLQENDEDLLRFDESDSDDGGEGEEEKYHKAPDSLEVASDESDFEADDALSVKKSSRDVTMTMVNSWQERLRTTKNKKLLREVVSAFHAAVMRVSTGDDGLFPYKVDGAPIFNAIIRMCVMDLYSGIKSTLKLSDETRTPLPQCKIWPKVRSILKMYFSDLAELIGVTSPSMLTVLLKHIHQMTPFLVYFPSLTNKTLKRLIDLWSKSEDVIRILSFLCILRITNHRHLYLSSTLKSMHMTYVRNTKFVSPNVLPEINFMRQSMAEMFALDDSVSYQMAFVYIRQLAVHLRNAITLKKKENFQAVYNWQFISSLQLWAELFGLVSDASPLRSLVYPLIQIIIGTIKLVPSAQYYPLRFHCCKILINLSNKCGVFIPVMPFLLEVLRDFDFNRDHKKLSMKPMDFSCILRCSKLQMKENGFKDAVIDNINTLLIESIATESHRVCFPDVMVPAVLQIKQFVKECKVMNYSKLMKAILEKVSENSKFIEEERKKLNFRLDDSNAMEAIEAGLKAKGTPFLNYYNNWKKVYMQQQARKVVDNIKLGDYKLPVIYKMDKKRSREQSKSAGPPELFPSDDDEELPSENDPEEESVEKKKKINPNKTKKKKSTPAKRAKINKKKNQEIEVDLDNGDIVEELVFSDNE